jgi:hypothetical protein
VFNGISYFLRVTVNRLIRAGHIAELYKGACTAQAEYDRGDLDRRGQQSGQGIQQGRVLWYSRLPGRDEFAARPKLAKWPLPSWRRFNDSISFSFHVRSIGKATEITLTKTEQNTAQFDFFQRLAIPLLIAIKI